MELCRLQFQAAADERVVVAKNLIVGTLLGQIAEIWLKGTAR
jgi:hypothetical protein